MSKHTMRERWLAPWIAVMMLGGVVIACTLFDPNTSQKYPWTVQPLHAETKAYFCQKLNLPSDHRVCRPERDVFARDLFEVLQERFPENKTSYSEIAEVLAGYPVGVEESTSPDGTVTSRVYVYLLTEFDGFCVYFGTTDLHSEIIERVYASSLGSGPSPTTCGSQELRMMPRPFLLEATPESVPATSVPGDTPVSTP